MARKLFACLAVAFLLGALVIMIDGWPGMSLNDGISMVDVMAVFSWQYDVRHYHLPLWLWNNVAVPWLNRPAWLPPACLAIMFGGCAVGARPRD